MYIKIGLLITADSHSKIKRIQFKCPILSIHLISVADYLPQCPAPSSRPALPTKFTSCWYRIPSPWQFPISGASVSLAFLSDSSLWSPRRARESTLPEGHFKECVARDHGHSTWCLCGCPAGLPSPQPHWGPSHQCTPFPDSLFPFINCGCWDQLWILPHPSPCLRSGEPKVSQLGYMHKWICNNKN